MLELEHYGVQREAPDRAGAVLAVPAVAEERMTGLRQVPTGGPLFLQDRF